MQSLLHAPYMENERHVAAGHSPTTPASSPAKLMFASAVCIAA
jgi:hypothetical protein